MPRINITKSMYPAQANFVRDVFKGNYPFVSCSAGRQAGKSYAIDRTSIGLSLRELNKSILWVTPSHDQSKDGMDRIVLICTEKGIAIHPVYTPGDRHITFLATNSTVHFRSSERFDLLRGKHPDYLLLDEFAFFKVGAWEKALAPYMIANKDLIVVAVSTFCGKNDFYDFIECGKNKKEPMFVSHTLHYSQNPNANIPFIMRQKRKLPKQVFEQEYEGIAVFGSSVVFGEFAHVQTITEWEKPDDKKIYFFGLDIAGDGEDETVLTIEDEAGETVLIYEVEAISHPNQARELIPIIKRYKNISGYGEKNGLGNSLCDLLIEGGINLNKWITTNESKQILVSEFIEDIADGKIKLPTSDLCPKLDNEMSMYIVKRTNTGKLVYTHPDGLHDDYVDSKMLSSHARKTEGYFEVYEENELEDYDDEEDLY